MGLRQLAVIFGLVLTCGLTLRRPFVGAWTIVVCAVLRDTLRVETYGYFLQCHGFEWLYIATFLSIFLAHPERLPDFIPGSMADWGMLGFLGVMIISAVVNGVSVLNSKYIDLFFKAVVLYFLVSRLTDTPRRVTLVAVALIVATTYLTYLAWSKYRSGELSYARPYYFTMIHDFGLLLVITLPLIGAMVAKKMWLPFRLALLGLIPLYVLVTLRTSSRSAMIGMGLALALLAWYHRKRWYLFIPGVPLVAYAIVHNPEGVQLRMQSIWTQETKFGNIDSSITSRFEQMRTAQNIVARNPIFGIGPRQFFRRYYDFVSAEDAAGGSYTMHAVPLLIACEEGLLGLLTYYGMLALGALLDGWYVARRTRGDPAMRSVAIVSAGALMCFLSFLVYGLGQPAMWVVNIYATVALVSATRRVVTAHLAEQAAEEKAAHGVPVPWLPRPATTEIVFS